MTLRALFEAEFGLRVGPRREDYRVMRPGETIEVSDELRMWNTSSGVSIFDLSPEQQVRECRRVICRLGNFPEVAGQDSRVAEAYGRPLSETRFAEVSDRFPVTSTTVRSFYVGPNDRRLP